MFYANEEIFSIGYNAELDRLQIKRKNQSKIGIIRKKIHENKMITTLVALFFMFCLLNCMLIYTFMDLLKNI